MTKIPSNNGRICRYYLKPEQENFINQKAVEFDKSPSQILREIIQIYKEILFLMIKSSGGNKK